MESQKIKSKGSGRLFKNAFLERITHTHFALPVSLFLVYATGLLLWCYWVTSLHWLIIVVLFFLGWLAFSWVEYMVHRYIFHMRTSSHRRARFQYTVHGVHHEFPKDKSRLSMPPAISLAIATLFLVLLKLVIGNYVFAFLPGFLTGYAMYLLVHYITHACTRPNNFLKILWIHHAIHHYRDSRKAFGVSSPLWDYIYKTMP